MEKLTYLKLAKQTTRLEISKYFQLKLLTTCSTFRFTAVPSKPVNLIFKSRTSIINFSSSSNPCFSDQNSDHRSARIKKSNSLRLF